MRIVHIKLSGIYTENFNYHTNGLSECNALDGHETTVITSCLCYKEGSVIKLPPSDKMLKENLRVIRIPYINPCRDFRFQKVRAVRGLYKLLDTLRPDVLFVDSPEFWSLRDVVRYKKDTANVKFYVDTHTAAVNSGTCWFSKNVLCKFFYKSIIQQAIPYIDKFFYISSAEKEFAIENFQIPETLMEFYPLGGRIPETSDYKFARQIRRQELGVADDEFLFVHSGKLDRLKRTEELLKSFIAVPDLKARLAIIGSVPDSTSESIMPLIEKDERIIYLGWKVFDELLEYLCACDLYLQPGGPSVTFQNAVCCGCPVMVFPYRPYADNYDYHNLIWVKTEDDMAKSFQQIADGVIDLNELKKNSERCAKELLDYRVLARRLYV